MEWHWTETFSIFHHLPHSLHDLLHHEDQELLKAGLPGLRVTPPRAESAHRVVLDSARPSSTIAIEKDMDPAVSRSQQNFGLLIHDYFQGLPEFTSTTPQADALLEHWRKILMEQPQRLAEAHLDSWNNERSRAFWKERLSHYKTDAGITSEQIIKAADDWERAAGAPVPSPQVQGAIKTKQWQDLLIRQRLHQLDLLNMSR